MASETDEIVRRYNMFWHRENAPTPPIIFGFFRNWARWTHHGDYTAIASASPNEYLENQVDLRQPEVIEGLESRFDSDLQFRDGFILEIVTRLHRAIHRDTVLDHVLSLETRRFPRSVLVKIGLLGTITVLLWLVLFGLVAWGTGVVQFSPSDRRPSEGLAPLQVPELQHLRSALLENPKNALAQHALRRVEGLADSATEDDFRDFLSRYFPLSWEPGRSVPASNSVSEAIEMRGNDSAADRPPPQTSSLRTRSADNRQQSPAPNALPTAAETPEFPFPSLVPDRLHRLLLYSAITRRATEHSSFRDELLIKLRAVTPLGSFGELVAQVLLIATSFTLLTIFLNKKRTILELFENEKTLFSKLILLKSLEARFEREFKTKKLLHYLAAAIAATLLILWQSLLLRRLTPSVDGLLWDIFRTYDYRLSFDRTPQLAAIYWITNGILIYLIVLTAWEIRQLQAVVANVLQSKLAATHATDSGWPSDSVLRGDPKRLRNALTAFTEEFDELAAPVKTEATGIFIAGIAFFVLQSALLALRLTFGASTYVNAPWELWVLYAAPLVLTIVVFAFFANPLHPLLTNIALSNPIDPENNAWVIKRIRRELGLPSGEGEGTEQGK